MVKKKDAIAFAAGLLFAVGLGLGGMTNPAKVIGFLDVFGAWDPSLLFVMAGAIAVHMPFSLWSKRQGMFLPDVPCATPMPGTPSSAPPIDRSLIVGSILFGIGWGLGGYCPGPGIVSIASGAYPALLFVAAMLAGMALYRFTAAANEGGYVNASTTRRTRGALRGTR